MKETIKKALIFGLVSSITMIIVGVTYAVVSNNVTSGTPLTASMWNEMAGNYQYDTTEVNTGKKWIDGKTIFRRAVSFTTPLLGQQIGFSVPGVDNIIIQNAYVKHTTWIASVNGLYADVNNNYAGFWYNITDGEFQFKTYNSGRAGLSATAIMEYTKQ